MADGDQIMALLAARWAEEGRLHDGTLVATVMSNLGLERFLAGRGLRLERTPVGDRYVVEAMRKGGWNLGGRAVGSYRDDRLCDHGRRADRRARSSWPRWRGPGSRRASLPRQFDRVPQMLKNVRFAAGARPLEADAVRPPSRRPRRVWRAAGRLLIRKSGTEPLIRVMAECEDEALLAQVVDEIVSAVTASAA